jgi:hypothetical protein
MDRFGAIQLGQRPARFDGMTGRWCKPHTTPWILPTGASYAHHRCRRTCRGGFVAGDRGLKRWPEFVTVSADRRPRLVIEADFCAPGAGRLHGVAVTPIEHGQLAIDVMREAKELGLAAMLVPPALKNRNLDHPFSVRSS